MDPVDRAGAWRVAVPPALVALVVTSYGAGRRLPWSDEMATWHASTLGWEDFRRLTGNVDAVIAPYYVLMHGWIDVFGDSPVALRAPSILAMSAAAGLVALVGRRLLGAGAGLLAGLLFAVVPSTARYAEEARPYALAVMGVALATLLLLRASETPSRRRWILYGAAVAFAGIMHVVTLTALLAHAWVALRDRHLRGWAPAAALGVACVLPLVVVGSGQDDVIQWITADGEAVRQLPTVLFGSRVVAWIVIGLGLLGAAVRWRSDRRSTVMLLLWAVVPPVFCYVTFSVLHVFLARYLLFTVPAWVLLAASVTPSLSPVRREVRMALAALLVVGLTFVGLEGQRAARHDPVGTEPDFRAAAQIVDEELRAGDGIIFSAGHRNGRRPFRYLHHRGEIGDYDDVLAGATPESRGRYGTEQCRDSSACLADVDRIWLISATRPGTEVLPGISARARSILDADFDRRKVGRAQWVRVYLLTRKPAA